MFGAAEGLQHQPRRYESQQRGLSAWLRFRDTEDCPRPAQSREVHKQLSHCWLKQRDKLTCRQVRNEPGKEPDLGPDWGHIAVPQHPAHQGLPPVAAVPPWGRHCPQTRSCHNLPRNCWLCHLQPFPTTSHSNGSPSGKVQINWCQASTSVNSRVDEGHK